MDDYHKLTDMEILKTFESLKKELMAELSKLRESSQNEAVVSNTSENISCDTTELECEREVNFTTSQENHISEYNFVAEFPNSSSSFKAEDENSEKTSMQKNGTCEVDDISKNEFDTVVPVILPDKKPDPIATVNMAEQSVVCKSEAKEGENPFSWKENEFDMEDNKLSCMREEYVKREEDVIYNDKETPTIKTEDRNEMNLTDMDLNHTVKDKDTNSRAEQINLILPGLSRVCKNESGIICAGEIVGGDLKIHDSIETTSVRYNKKISKKSVTLIQQKYGNIPKRKENNIKNKKFARTENLKVYLRVHEGIRPYECPQCNKRFTNNGNMKRHLRIHDGIRPYGCPKCNKRFTRSERLKTHLKIHERIRPYGCPQCNKRYTKNGDLKTHLRIHELIRPYGCSKCNKRFYRRGDLETHLRIHEGVRPYGCPQCNKRFTQRGNLKKHLRIHEGIRPY